MKNGLYLKCVSQKTAHGKSCEIRRGLNINFCQTMMNNVVGEFAAYDHALPKNRDWQSILCVRYFSFSMTIRKHKIAEMNVKGVNKYNSNLDLAKRFPIVFKPKRNIKTQIITLSLLPGMLFCI